MADKKVAKKSEKVAKVTPKTVKKDIAKTAKDLRALTEQELHEALAAAKNDLLNAQKMLKANELPNTTVVKNSRKFIAKIHTVLAEKINEGKEQK